MNVNDISWSLTTRKLISIQKKIKKTKKNRRLCRNFQRLLYKNSFIQSLIIRSIFKKTLFIKNNKYSYKPEIFDKINFIQLISKSYRFHFKNYIMQILWSLSIWPLLNNNHNLLFITKQQGFELFKILSKIFNKPYVQYIMVIQFSNIFNKKNKYFILSRLLVEKKFLLNFFKQRKNSILKEFENYKLDDLPQDILCLKRLLKHYVNLNLYNFFSNTKKKFAIYDNCFRIRNNFSKNLFKKSNNKIFKQRKIPLLKRLSINILIQYNLYPKNTLFKIYNLNSYKISKPFFCFIKFSLKKNFYKLLLFNNKKKFYLKNYKFMNRKHKFLKNSCFFIEYSEYILFMFQTKKNLFFAKKILKHYAEFYNIRINYMKFYSINKGIKFLGWFFIKNTQNSFSTISYENLYSHQKEIKKYLKKSINKPIDTTIYGLNRKIFYWQKFYNFSIKSSKFWSKMNDFLFWQIWFWIKKRYHNKQAKWLYNRYWKKSTSSQWIFSVNNESLVFYKK